MEKNRQKMYWVFAKERLRGFEICIFLNLLLNFCSSFSVDIVESHKYFIFYVLFYFSCCN